MARSGGKQRGVVGRPRSTVDEPLTGPGDPQEAPPDLPPRRMTAGVLAGIRAVSDAEAADVPPAQEEAEE